MNHINETDYKAFVCYTADHLSTYLPSGLEGAEIAPRQVNKLQGQSYYGISLQPKGSNIAATIDLHPAYCSFCDGAGDGIQLEDVLRNIANELSEGFKKHPSLEEVKRLTDYECVKEKLFIQVVSAESNKEMLKMCPHRDIEDLSLVYRIIIEESVASFQSILITNQMLDTYGITEEHLHADAEKNSSEHFPATFSSILSQLSEMAGVPYESGPLDPSMYIATCNGGRNGAGCIFYPGFLESVHEKLGGDFYIIPSSIHEMIIVPMQGAIPPKDIINIIFSINHQEVLPEDRLSDSLYQFTESGGFEKIA